MRYRNKILRSWPLFPKKDYWNGKIISIDFREHARDNQESNLIQAHKKTALDLSFSPNNEFLLNTCDSDEIAFWDIRRLG